jgi:very-short-patch-repair endonuclease
MTSRLFIGGAAGAPPLEKGRSAREASRVGIKNSRFDRTKFKTARARQLRRNSTDVEMKLWQRLRNNQLGVDFRRQHPAGPFILDFYCPALRLAIELDGGQHGNGEIAERDSKRTQWLAGRNVAEIRFWNSDLVDNLSGVLEVIASKVTELQSANVIPTRRWRADLPFSRGGDSRRGRNS